MKDDIWQLRKSSNILVLFPNLKLWFNLSFVFSSSFLKEITSTSSFSQCSSFSFDWLLTTYSIFFASSSFFFRTETVILSKLWSFFPHVSSFWISISISSRVLTSYASRFTSPSMSLSYESIFSSYLSSSLLLVFASMSMKISYSLLIN